MSGTEPQDASAKSRNEKSRTFKLFDPESGKFTESGQSEAQEARTNFEFIDTAKPGEPASTKARKAVRVHVMRQYHKRVREQVAGTTRRRDQYASTILPENSTNEDPGFDMTLTPFSPTGALVTQIEPFRLPVQVARESPATADKGNCNNNRKSLGSESHNVALRARVQLLPKPTLDSIRPGLNAPFLGPLQMDASSLNLLRFFFEVVVRTSIPLSPLAVSEYLKDVTAESPALRHGTLLLASTYHALWRGLPVPSMCHYHSMLTIQCVNSSLETVEGQIADGTSAAVACLAAFENAVDPTTKSSVHIAGLETLKKIRVSHRSSSASYLPKLVEWVDLVNATSNLTKPRFLPQQAPRNDASAADEEKFEANLDAQWGPDLSSDLVTMFEGMDNRMEKLFHRVRQLSASANNMERSNVNPELQEQYNQGVHLLECQVNASIWSLSLNNIRQHGSATQSKELIAVRTCCRTWHDPDA